MSRSLLAGRLKAPALVSLRVIASPATLRDRGGWFGFWNKLMMNLNNLPICCLIGPTGPVAGARMFADRNQEAHHHGNRCGSGFQRAPVPARSRRGWREWMAGLSPVPTPEAMARNKVGGVISQTLPYPKKHDDSTTLPTRC